MGSVLRWTPEELDNWLARQHSGKGPKRIKPATPAPRSAGIKVKTRKQRERAEIIEMLLLHIRGSFIPEPQLEYRFHPTRKWLSDFAWPEQKVLAEYEGGIWTNGAHVRGKHYESDCEKYNAAALLGFRVLRFTIGMVESGLAIQTLEEALKQC